MSVLVLLCLFLHSQGAPAGHSPGFIADTPEVRQAKAEFMQSFKRALSGLLSELAPKDTPEVKQAKMEFFNIFNKALDGVIESVFLEDTEEVRERKEAFLKTFNAAMTDLFITVEGIYTPEQVEARRKFHQAYKDAEAGKVGAQYLEETSEVKVAKERFFKYFKFVLDGMLYKLSPKPGHNVIPEEIADFYLKDEPDVFAEKTKFDKLYRDALNGDVASAIAVVALDTAINNNENDPEAAIKELDETLDAIVEEVEEEYDLNETEEGENYDSYETDLDEDIEDVDIDTAGDDYDDYEDFY